MACRAKVDMPARFALASQGCFLCQDSAGALRYWLAKSGLSSLLTADQIKTHTFDICVLGKTVRRQFAQRAAIHHMETRFPAMTWRDMGSTAAAALGPTCVANAGSTWQAIATSAGKPPFL